jgi:hypothetical protein
MPDDADDCRRMIWAYFEKTDPGRLWTGVSEMVDVLMSVPIPEWEEFQREFETKRDMA